jgi:hypothetical protein
MYIKWPYYRPNVHKMYLHVPLQGPPKFTQIRIFGLKKCRLATLTLSTNVAEQGEHSGHCSSKMRNRRFNIFLFHAPHEIIFTEFSCETKINVQLENCCHFNG